jgi:uncharacterized integral membrane protein
MTTARDGMPSVNPDPPDSVGALAPIESRRARLLRHGRRARLYAWAVSFVALLVVLIVLIAANLRSVKLDWVVGSTRASLVWIVLAATVLGWLLGITTSVLFRYRTRRPQSRG